MVTSKDIGKTFIEAREKLSMSQEAAAAKSHIHHNVIVDLENGVFDRLNKLYIKGFLKKYSAFLGLDTEDILGKFDSIAPTLPQQGFVYDVDSSHDETKTKAEKVTDMVENKLQIAGVVALSVVFLVLVVVLMGVVRSKMAPAEKKEAPVVSQTTSVPLQKRTMDTVSKAAATKTPPATSQVTLTLKSRGRSWVKITEGDKTLFVGFLEDGDKKTWEAAGPITVWTGKADMLEFYVNTKKVGIIAAGVVRNIKVSSEGVKIGNDWVTKFD